MANMAKDKFSVIMEVVSVAARIILKHWKTPKAPQFKEWVTMMIRMASYECMLCTLNNKHTISDWTFLELYASERQHLNISSLIILV